LVLSLQSLDLLLALIVEVVEGLSVFSVECVDLVFVGDVCVLKLMEPLLLALGVIGFQLLNLKPERLILRNDLLLALLIISSLLRYLDGGVGNVDLQMLTLVLTVLQQFLVNHHILRQVIHYLFR